MPNTALLAAFLTLTNLLPVAGLKDALAQRFKGDVLARNLDLIDQVAAATPTGLWQERAHATSA
jgi:pyruvate ferredoxin oxidoreductase gamma subunit